MPIDRGGKHWCAPEREDPDAEGKWVCPGCGTVWLYSNPAGYDGLWETPESRDLRLEQEAEMARIRQQAEEDMGVMEPLADKGDEV